MSSSGNGQQPLCLSLRSQDCLWPQSFRRAAAARQQLCLVYKDCPFSKALRGIPCPHDKRQQTVAQWPISKDVGILSKHPADCAHVENPSHAPESITCAYCIHACTCIHIHTYIHTSMHACMHACMHTFMLHTALYTTYYILHTTHYILHACIHTYTHTA